jgi:transposase
MNASESALSREEMERRRLAAAQQLLSGYSQSRVARLHGVSRTTASRWHSAVVDKGVDSLKKRRATGRPSRLTAEQYREIAKIYAEGALAHGFALDRWTTAKLAEVIEARFRISYDEDHVGRIIHKLGLRSPKLRLAPEAIYTPSLYSPKAHLSAADISPTVA